jgi:ribonuclease HI
MTANSVRDVEPVLMEMPKVEIWTDGCSLGNPGPSGWACVMIWNGSRRDHWGMNSYSTNNAMELTAILEGLKHLAVPCDVTIYTDSKNAIGWLSQGSKRNAVNIIALCRTIDQLIVTSGHSVQYRKVPAHKDNWYNNIADELAKRAAASQERPF